jgi:DNA (cytosine-5)-methyltransferase 1
VRYLSLFSGIEAATVAWAPLGWEPVAFAEIDGFPSAVLAERFPGVPNLGDVTEINWKEFMDERGAVDVVVGGSPCQSFSVAGGRESLRGESRLMFEYIRAVDELRPKWLVWENVPGCLSAKGLDGEVGGAFRQLLREMDVLGYGLAWRVLDAQFFGVAQRRRRVFLVGRLGDPAGPCSVLFDAEGLQGNPLPSGEARKAAAARAQAGARVDSRPGFGVITQDGEDVSRTLTARMDGSPSVEGRGPSVVCMASDTVNAAVDEDVCGTLHVGGGKAFIASGSPTGMHGPSWMLKVRCGADTYVRPDGTVGTAGKGALVGEEVAFTLSTAQDQTLVGRDAGGYTVRRLTPTECERLQGFPDGWTRIPWRGKPAEECPDGPRYKALGNSMAVPVMAWIGRRMEAYDLLF